MSTRGVKRPRKTLQRRMYAPSLISCAIEYLKRARADLRAAGALQTLAKLNSTIKSAEGARRNAERFSPILNPESAKGERLSL